MPFPAGRGNKGSSCEQQSCHHYDRFGYGGCYLYRTLEPEVVAKIIEKERPDGIICRSGGQTGLNITSEIAEMGVLEKFNVELLGNILQAIKIRKTAISSSEK